MSITPHEAESLHAPGSASRRGILKVAAAALAIPALPRWARASQERVGLTPAGDNAGRSIMGTVTVGQENSTPIDLYYEDHGAGKPVILIHGYPLNGASWEKQTAALLGAGQRVITYDRRGFGKSSQPTVGYDYDTFAEDLRKLITSLKLRDVALVGFSMGGGEVARYFGKYGSAGIRRAVIVSGVPPYLLKAPDNPEGVDISVFNGIEAAIRADRYAFFSDFFKNFYNTDVLLGKAISEQAVQASWNVAVGSSPTATLQCVHTWYTDFRKDLPRIDVPTLVLHGDADRILPITASGARTAQLIKGAKYVVIKGAPHGMGWTHADQVSAELVNFLK
jgi:non-heme chloroperoxidase